MNEHNKNIINQTKNYIEYNKDFKNFIDNHKNLFCIATLYNEINLIETLINKIKREFNENILGKYINYLSEDGATPLHYSVYNGNKEMVILLCKNGANPNLKSFYGESALELAKRKLSDYTEIVKQLESNNNLVEE